MEAVIIKATTKSEAKFLMELAKKIGASAKTVSLENLEDVFLAQSIDEGIKSGIADKQKVLKKLSVK